MAVISSAPIAEQRRGPTFAGDGSLARTYVLVFQVITDSYLTGGLQALIQGTAIPPLYSPYDLRPYGGVEFDPGARLVGYDCYQPEKDAPNLWYVRCDYSSKSLDPQELSQNQGENPSHEGGGDHNENPLLRPVKFNYRKQGGRRTLYKSRGRTEQNGQFFPAEVPFQNSAGQAYNPGPEVASPIKTLTIVKNLAAIDVLAAMEFEDTVNDSPFLGFPAGCVKCDSIDPESVFENGLGFVTVTYTFSLRAPGSNDGLGEPWDWEPLDKGTYYLDENDKPARFTDTAGNPLPDGLLNGNGEPLEDGEDPVINSYRIYPRKDFSALGLP